jgi:hypothetical protein
MPFTFPTTGRIKMSEVRSSLSKTGLFKISDFRTPLNKLSGSIKWSDLRGKTFGQPVIQYPNGFLVGYNFTGATATNTNPPTDSKNGYQIQADITNGYSPKGAMSVSGQWYSKSKTGWVNYIPASPAEDSLYYVSQYTFSNRAYNYQTYDKPISWYLQIYDLLTNSWKTIDTRSYTLATTPMNNGTPQTFTCSYLGYPTRPSQFRLVITDASRYASVSNWSMKMMPNPA